MIESYIQEYQKKPQSQVSWLQDDRTRTADRLVKSGFPTSRLEAWKDIDLRLVTLDHFPQSKTLPLEPSLQKWKSIFPDAIFVNDSTKSLPKGLSVRPMLEAIESSSSARELFGIQPNDSHAFFDLNQLLTDSGFFIEIEDNASIAHPIVILHTGQTRHANYPRTLVSAGRSSQATIIELFVSESNDEYLVIPVTQIHQKQNSKISHLQLGFEGEKTQNVGLILGKVDQDARLSTMSFSFGGQLTRKDIQVDLCGRGSHCDMDGIYVPSGSQTVDHHTLVRHLEPMCTSSENYKGVLLDRSLSVFEGRIYVAQDAQKTDAFQLNQNLMLSGDARIHSAPQLEIYADDVKCSHGSTIGRLDEAALFYLRSRGIGLMEARKMLIEAYVQEVIEKVSFAEIQNILKQQLLNKIRAVGS